nr:hypothetical protein [uncultured Romboutsia sp.]
MLRYEQIIKEYLENDNIKLLGIEQDNRILVEIEKEQKIFKATLVENNLIIIKNVHDEIEYTIELR